MQTPKPTALALILAIVYLIWPIDLIPDLFGPVGRIDDLLVIALVAWQAYKYARAQKTPNTENSTPPNMEEHNKDAYEVFALPVGASSSEIEARYKELARQYHPDKVAHLGIDLQKLAHEKMIEIQRAYDELLAKATRG